MKILIAGASGGIGSFLAERLSLGHEVYGTYHSKPPEGELNYKMTKVDVTNEDDVSGWITKICDSKDDIALIYCIGTNYNCMMHKSDSTLWRDVIDSNLIGVQHVLRQVLPFMREKKYGRIILLSSVVPQVGVPGTSAYAASKAALWGLSKAIAKENASYGITINSVNLGYFNIGMIQDVPPKALEDIIEHIPLRSLGNPNNILNAVEFLVKSDYITGSELDINGGIW